MKTIILPGEAEEQAGDLEEIKRAITNVVFTVEHLAGAIFSINDRLTKLEERINNAHLED